MAENKNKLGKYFKQQTWYSNFLKKPIEKIQAILPFKKYELKELKEFSRITESLEGTIVHMSSVSGRNQEQFKLIEKIGCIGFDAVFYSAKRLSDKKEVCRAHFFLKVYFKYYLFFISIGGSEGESITLSSRIKVS